ncbi:MAG: VWA domain-containing protein [Thioalkalispiraceae bacterium]
MCPRFWIACLLLILPLAAGAEAVSDVRVLIDVSGSMKKNDPRNLRAPAVKMLVGLLPDNTKSGIWTFGRYVNMQVKLGKVNKTWKKQAMQEADKIHSRGLYTNIEEAIKRSTVDWIQPDPDYERHLILLTDGMVDIGKESRLNEQSRRRVLDELLPRLEKADVTIHSIALSENADAELLNTLSAATRGAFDQVNNAEQLQRIFLKLFEKSVKPDTLPIEDNKFFVDKHVDDITVLIFLAKDSPATKLSTPGGKIWSATKHPQDITWYHDKGYDLITVKEPVAGEWNLQAKVDPDNRVMVVSNLRLKVDKIPNTIMLGDTFDVRARLIEEGKTVTNHNLLGKTNFSVRQTKNNSYLDKKDLSDNGQVPDVISGDGVFSAAVNNITSAGEYNLSVQARSLTFTRESIHTLKVYDTPASISITQAGVDKPFRVMIKPYVGLIRPESVSMQITLPNGKKTIATQDDDNNWVVDIDNKFAGKNITLTVAGTRYTDEPVKMDFEQVLAVTDGSQSVALKVKPKPVPEKAEHTEQAAQTDEKTDKQSEKKTEIEPQKTKEGFSWWIVMALVVGVNILVIGGGWFAFRTWKKRQQQEEDKVEAALQHE